MTKNPYEILGISSNASNDDIKRAYRELSRKYHPDSYINNPLSDLAEEKFKEVQEAYDVIMKEKENGGYSQTSYSGSSSDNSSEMATVCSEINSRNFREALANLDRITNRSARWYYYSAAANMGIGNNVQALNHARTANNMEPNNPEYSSLVNQLQWSGQRYQTNSYNSGRSSVGTGNFCCDLWCADSLCECMGGDLCSCM